MKQETENSVPVMHLCPACSIESSGKLCMHCGEKLQPQKITFYKLIRDIPDVFFDIDNGLFYTMYSFLLKPGEQIRKYFAGDRKRHYKPLKFVLFIGGFTAFLYSKYQFTDGTPQTGFDEFGTRWNSLLLLLQLPVIAFFTWLFFKKRNYTFGEHLVANAYIIAEVSLFNIVLFPLYYFLDGTSSIVFAHVLYLICILYYYSFAFYDWFYHRKGNEGRVLSFVFVLLLFTLVVIVTFILQLLLYYFFNKAGWV